MEIPVLVLPKFVRGEWIYPGKTSWQKEATAVRFSSRTRQASHCRIQRLQMALKFWKACCLHLYNRGKFARTLSGKIRKPEKSLCHVCEGWKKTQGRPKAAPLKHRTHVNSVAFLCVAKCGVKGLALMNGTAKLCRNKETELFLYCIYTCYFYYNAVLL